MDLTGADSGVRLIEASDPCWKSLSGSRCSRRWRCERQEGWRWRSKAELLESSAKRSRALRVVLAALVFALGVSRPGEAAVIECASEYVACLIAAINTANANGEANGTPV